jgi:hypothetical protein
LNTRTTSEVAITLLTLESGVPTSSTPRTSSSAPLLASTRYTSRGVPLKAWYPYDAVLVLPPAMSRMTSP